MPRTETLTAYDEMYKKVMSLLGLESKRALPPSVPDYLFDPILEMDRVRRKFTPTWDRNTHCFE
jgi:hypothetical protein